MTTSKILSLLEQFCYHYSLEEYQESFPAITLLRDNPLPWTAGHLAVAKTLDLLMATCPAYAEYRTPLSKVRPMTTSLLFLVNAKDKSQDVPRAKLGYLDITDNTEVLLGEITTAEEFIDYRMHGGKANESYVSSEYQKRKEMRSYTDIGRYDGSPAGLENVVFIEFPDTLLKKYTMDEIRALIFKYIPAGVQPILFTYEDYI